LTSIKIIEKVILNGEKYAWAMPRGSGKTTLARMATTWASLYGHLQYPVIVGATNGSAANILGAIKTALSSPGLLADDFPEVCFPIMELNGKSQATHSQTCEGERTRIKWTAEKIVLPTVRGSKVSGTVIQCFGLTGGLRGAFEVTEEGVTLRPDCALLDDPQTDESAVSPTQCETREKLINGAVLKMSGPDKKMAALMPCTIICRHDLAYRMLDRKQNPSWRGTVTKMLEHMPTNMEFWENEYRTVWTEGLLSEDDNGEKTAYFYAMNREKLEEGCVPTWSDRIEGNDISAIQTAMHIYLEDKNSFFSEYQNEPIDPFADAGTHLDAEQLAGRCTPIPSGVIPISTPNNSQVDVLLYRAESYQVTQTI